MESRKKSLPKKFTRPPRPGTEEEKQVLLLLVLLRMAELVERWKRGAAVKRLPASPIRRADAKSERALRDFVGVVFEGRLKETKQKSGG